MWFLFRHFPLPPPPHPYLPPLFFNHTVVAQELAWAYSENNANVFSLFSKVAELQHIYAEAEKKMAEKVRKDLRGMTNSSPHHHHHVSRNYNSV